MCRLLAFVLIGSLLALGCGNGKPAVVPATGKVIFARSKPAVGALVVFHPSPEQEKVIGGKPFGKVGPDGTFKLTTYNEDDGAPEGDYGVTVDWRGGATSKFSLSGEGGGGSRSLLKPTYGDPRQPTLKATVKKGAPNDFTFDVD